MGKYDTTRYNHNLNRAVLDVEGEFDIPIIRPVTELELPETFVDFNYAVGHQSGAERQGVHFFLDDYRFERLWNNPDAYLQMLGKYKVVLSPDFSTYTDWPLAVQIYNHWRKHWLGAYLQGRGCTVVPTISWGDPTSHWWCFEGEPTDSIVAVGTRGSNADARARREFEAGFEAMMEQLRPSRVLAFGGHMGVFDRYPGLVERVDDEYSKRLRKVAEDRKLKRANSVKGYIDK